ncbi:unnamed protein product, partial [Ectocarpus sp. 12 AP-2014]
MEAAVAAVERELAAAAAACEESTASAEEAKNAGALLRAEAGTALAVHRKQVKHMQVLSNAPAYDPALPVAEGKTVKDAAAAASGATSPRAPAATTAGFQLQEGDFPQLPSPKKKTASPGRRPRTPPELITVGYVTPADARERAGDAPTLDAPAAATTAAAGDAATAATAATAAAAGEEPPPLRAHHLTDSQKAHIIEQQQEELRAWHERDFEDIAAEAAAGGDGAGGVTAPHTAGEVHAAAERAVQRAQAAEVEARGAKWVARVQQYKKHNAGASLEEAVHRVWESYTNNFYLYNPDTTPAPPSEPPAWYIRAVAASTASPRHTWAQLTAASPEPSPQARTAAPPPPAPVPVVAGPTPRRFQHIRHGASSSSSPQGFSPVATAATAAPPGNSTAIAAATSHRRYQHTRHGPPPSPPVPLHTTTAVVRGVHRPTVSTTANHGHHVTAAASTNSSHRSTTAVPAISDHRPTAAPAHTQRGHTTRHTNLPPYPDQAPAPTYQPPRPTPSPAAAPHARRSTPPAAPTRYHIRHTNVPSWSATSAALAAEPSRMHDASAPWAATAEIDATRSRRPSSSSPYTTAVAPTAPLHGGPSNTTPVPAPVEAAAPSRRPAPVPSSAFGNARGEGPASSPWVTPTREPEVSEREQQLEREVQRLAVQLAAAKVGG